MVTRRSSFHEWTPRRLVRLLCAVGCGALLVACGYRPYGVGAASLGDSSREIQRLHLEVLTNNTFKPGLQGLVGGAIQRSLQRDGRIRLTAPEVADAILAGNLTSYENDPIAFEQIDIGRRFRVRLHLAIRLKERGGEKVLLTEEMVGEAFYTAGTGAVATRAAEEEATARAAQDLASRVVARLMEGL